MIELHEIWWYEQELNVNKAISESLLQIRQILEINEPLYEEWLIRYNRIKKDIIKLLCEIHEKGYWIELDEYEFIYLVKQDETN